MQVKAGSAGAFLDLLHQLAANISSTSSKLNPTLQHLGNPAHRREREGPGSSVCFERMLHRVTEMLLCVFKNYKVYSTSPVANFRSFGMAEAKQDSLPNQASNDDLQF